MYEPPTDEMKDRKKLRTEACAQGMHRLCDGKGTLDDGVTPIECRCYCHEPIVRGDRKVAAQRER
jgi:hypothetical protein